MVALLVGPATAAVAADGADPEAPQDATAAPPEEPQDATAAPPESEDAAGESEEPVPGESEEPAPEVPDEPAPGAVEEPAPAASESPDAAEPAAVPPAQPAGADPEPRSAVAAQAAIAAIVPEALVGFDSAVLADSLAVAWYGDSDPGTRVTFLSALAQAPAGSTIHIDNTLGTAFRFTTSAFARSQAVTIDADEQTQLFFARLNFSGSSLTFSPNVVLTPTANNQIAVNVTSTVSPTITGLQVANDPVTPRTGGTAVNLTSTSGATVTGLTTLGIVTGANLATSSGATVTGASISGATTGVNLTSSSGATITGSSISGGTTGVNFATSSGGALEDSSISGATTGVNLATATDAAISGSTITGVTNGIVTTAASTAAGPEVSGVTIESMTLGISLGDTTGATIDDVSITRSGEPTTNAGVLGINVNNASGVTITNADVRGYRSAISVAAANDAAPLSITGATVDGYVSAITLGSTAGAVLTDVTASGIPNAAGVLSTVAVDIPAGAGATTVTGLQATDVKSGVLIAVANVSTGMLIQNSSIAIGNATSGAGVNLGGATDPIVRNVTVTGPGRTITNTGITAARSSGATIDDVTVSAVSAGISSTRASGFPSERLAGPVITDASLLDVGTGVYFGQRDGAVVRTSAIESSGDGVFGHENENVVVDRITYTSTGGDPVVCPSGRNSAVRFYYTNGLTVTDLTASGASQGLYLDMTTEVVAERLDISAMTCWALAYAEGVTGLEVRDSVVRDNIGGIANFTYNPSTGVRDARIVSSGILIEDSTFTNTPAGIHFPLGAEDFTFRNNDVSGPRTYVIVAQPSHDVIVEGNRIDFTYTPSARNDVDVLGESPPDPGAPPPADSDVEHGPVDAAGAAPALVGEVIPFMDAPAIASPVAVPAIVLPMSPIPPPTPQAAIYITTTWFNLDTQSASSSGIQVLDNVFTGDGPFLGVGSVSTVDQGTPLAPSNPSAARTLRDTIDVSRNTFPTDSTAIVTAANAAQGDDSDPTNDLIDGVVAVDARGDNDWGSECGPREPVSGYDGGGAFIHLVDPVQVLYPQLCSEEPGIELSALPHCVPTGGYADYTILLTGTSEPPAGPIALIWWTQEGYAARDATIDAGDTAALLADGAVEVRNILVPSDWSPGQPITGIAPIPKYFPDHRVLPRLEARVNPSDSVDFPPPDLSSAECAGGAAVPGLAGTGGDPGAAPVVAAVVIALGALALAFARRRAGRLR